MKQEACNHSKMMSRDMPSLQWRGAGAVLTPEDEERKGRGGFENHGRACRATGAVLSVLTCSPCVSGYWANMQNKPVSNFIVKRFA